MILPYQQPYLHYILLVILNMTLALIGYKYLLNFLGLSNSSIDVLWSMGITCSRKTARGIIKLAGNRCDEMAMIILEYQKKAVSLGSLVDQLAKLMKAIQLSILF